LRLSRTRQAPELTDCAVETPRGLGHGTTQAAGKVLSKADRLAGKVAALLADTRSLESTERARKPPLEMRLHGFVNGEMQQSLPAPMQLTLDPPPLVLPYAARSRSIGGSE
jgi:hypothetical protein